MTVALHADVRPEQRFTRQRPCPVCGGYRELAPGRGERCYGFISDDAEWAVCTREEKAGPLAHNGAGFSHHLTGGCGCGVTHATAAAPVPPTHIGYATKGRDRPSMRRGTLETVYVYRDERGQPVHRTLRFRDPKSFAQQQYDQGFWKRSLAGVRKVLYRLPELLAADPSEPVFLPEGEKDCDLLASLGLVATTNPCGASGWETHYKEWLRGRHVVILEDNDQAGRERSVLLTRELEDVCRIDLIHFRRMPEGYDVSDWLDTGKVEDLLRCMQDIG